MQGSSSGRVALVTGAGRRRVGNVIARMLAERGYHVALHYRTSAQEAQQTATELEQQGVRARAFPGDVAVEAEVDRLFDQVR